MQFSARAPSSLILTTCAAKVLRRNSDSFSGGSDFLVIELVTDLTFSRAHLIFVPLRSAVAGALQKFSAP
jgi:hypothetical protein